MLKRLRHMRQSPRSPSVPTRLQGIYLFLTQAWVGDNGKPGIVVVVVWKVVSTEHLAWQRMENLNLSFLWMENRSYLVQTTEENRSNGPKGNVFNWTFVLSPERFAAVRKACSERAMSGGAKSERRIDAAAVREGSEGSRSGDVRRK